MSSTTNDSTNRKASAPFNSDDADLTFVSSDGVIFKIHSKNLEVNTSGFPPSEFKHNDELIHLTEDSETLNILFAFIYPQRHPDLEATPFETLEKVAEAAEKYQVFSAMNVCKIRMKSRVGTQGETLNIMLYGFKHGYNDIVRVASPLLHNAPLADTVARLPTSLIIPWVKYHENWRKTIENSFMNMPSTHSFRKLARQCPDSLKDLSLAFFRLRKALGDEYGWSYECAEVKKESLFAGCTHMNSNFVSWSLKDETYKLPALDTFL